MACVAEPALHARVEIVPIEPATAVQLREPPQPPGEAVAVVVAQPAPVRENEIAQHVESLCRGGDVRLVRVQPKV